MIGSVQVRNPTKGPQHEHARPKKCAGHVAGARRELVRAPNWTGLGDQLPIREHGDRSASRHEARIAASNLAVPRHTSHFDEGITVTTTVIHADLTVEFEGGRAEIRGRADTIDVTLVGSPATVPTGIRRLADFAGVLAGHLDVAITIRDPRGRMLVRIDPALNSRLWKTVTGSPHVTLKPASARSALSFVGRWTKRTATNRKAR